MEGQVRAIQIYHRGVQVSGAENQLVELPNPLGFGEDKVVWDFTEFGVRITLKAHDSATFTLPWFQVTFIEEKGIEPEEAGQEG
jgi:hypothetical protein